MYDDTLGHLNNWYEQLKLLTKSKNKKWEISIRQKCAIDCVLINKQYVLDKSIGLDPRHVRGNGVHCEFMVYRIDKRDGRSRCI